MLALVAVGMGVASSALAITGQIRTPLDLHRRHARDHLRPVADHPHHDQAVPVAGVTAAAAPHRDAARPTVRVTVGNRGAGRPVPPAFLGLSVEYNELGDDERHPRTLARVLRLLHQRGSGPTTLRIGGDSASATFPAQSRPRRARWAYGVGPGWLSRTARLVRAARLRVVLDLNAVSGSSRQAAALVRRARTRLPPDSIAGLEVGNEPDLYSRAHWRRQVGADRAASARLVASIGPSRYLADYRAFARELETVAPGTPLLGPALGLPLTDQRWVTALLRGAHPGLAAITGHEYPYSACAPPGTWKRPTVARLASPQAAQLMGANLLPTVRRAARAGLPVDVTEFNSVTCHGRPGVSDSFATALWAPGALFSMAHAGVRSADLHARSRTVNSPFTWDGHGLVAHPLLYGMALFERALGRRSRLLPVDLSGRGAGGLEAFAVASAAGRVRLLVIDPRRDGATLRVRVAGARSAAVQRLRAPGPTARGRVTLAGQRLGSDGRWVGRRVAPGLPVRRDVVTVSIDGTSAALTTIRVAGAG